MGPNLERDLGARKGRSGPRRCLETGLQTAGGQKSISKPANIAIQDWWQALINVCLRIDRRRLEEDGLTESWARAGHLLLKPGEHVGHESPPSQGSLLGPSLLVQRESIAASGQAQPPHQLSSNLEEKEREGKVRPLRGLVRTSGGADSIGGVFQVSQSCPTHPSLK